MPALCHLFKEPEMRLETEAAGILVTTQPDRKQNLLLDDGCPRFDGFSF
jgi:hypothetical protein